MLGADHPRLRSAAASLWLPSLAGQIAVLVHPTLRSRRRVHVTRRGVPSDFVQIADGLRFATPAYAAVELREALEAMTGSAGRAVRRCVVEECMTNPWSYAELRLHRILRAAGIVGWVANVRSSSGRRFWWAGSHCYSWGRRTFGHTLLR